MQGDASRRTQGRLALHVTPHPQTSEGYKKELTWIKIISKVGKS